MTYRAMRRAGAARLLVVDDSTATRRIIVSFLQRIGYTDVVEATDGQEAMARFDGSVDVVITDWMMPQMSGLDLVRALRAAGHPVPILMVTSHSGRTDIVRAMKAGADDYIVKPFTYQVLKEKLEPLVAPLARIN